MSKPINLNDDLYNLPIHGFKGWLFTPIAVADKTAIIEPFHTIIAWWDTTVVTGEVIAAIEVEPGEAKVTPIVFAAPGLPARQAGCRILLTGTDFGGTVINTVTANVKYYVYGAQIGS